MTSKINPISIFQGHGSTLVNATDGKRSLVDITVFYIVPIIFGIAAWFFVANISDEIINILVNCSAIFIGLLLNLLVLVYDQKNRFKKGSNSDNSVEEWNAGSARVRLLHELYYNISYSILIAIVLLLTSLAHIGFKDIELGPFDIKQFTGLEFIPREDITSPIITFLGLNFVLTLMMVLKRFHTLLTTD